MKQQSNGLREVHANFGNFIKKKLFILPIVFKNVFFTQQLNKKQKRKVSPKKSLRPLFGSIKFQVEKI